MTLAFSLFNLVHPDPFVLQGSTTGGKSAVSLLPSPLKPSLTLPKASLTHYATDTNKTLSYRALVLWNVFIIIAGSFITVRRSQFSVSTELISLSPGRRFIRSDRVYHRSARGWQHQVVWLRRQLELW
jgi:hypothetical protein